MQQAPSQQSAGSCKEHPVVIKSDPVRGSDAFKWFADFTPTSDNAVKHMAICPPVLAEFDTCLIDTMFTGSIQAGVVDPISKTFPITFLNLAEAEQTDFRMCEGMGAANLRQWLNEVNSQADAATFKDDPDAMLDPSITAEGLQQCREAIKQFRALGLPAPELVLSSPLRRAIQSAIIHTIGLYNEDRDLDDDFVGPSIWLTDLLREVVKHDDFLQRHGVDFIEEHIIARDGSGRTVCPKCPCAYDADDQACDLDVFLSKYEHFDDIDSELDLPTIKFAAPHTFRDDDPFQMIEEPSIGVTMRAVMAWQTLFADEGLQYRQILSVECHHGIATEMLRMIGHPAGNSSIWPGQCVPVLVKGVKKAQMGVVGYKDPVLMRGLQSK